MQRRRHFQEFVRATLGFTKRSLFYSREGVSLCGAKAGTLPAREPRGISWPTTGSILTG